MEAIALMGQAVGADMFRADAHQASSADLKRAGFKCKADAARGGPGLLGMFCVCL